jgi:hypothetical protein
MLFRKKSKDGPPGKKLWETYFKEMLKKNMQKALAVLNELKELEPDNSHFLSHKRSTSGEGDSHI